MWILGLKGLKTRYCPQNHMDLDWFYTIRSQPNPLDEQQGAVGRGHTSHQCGWVRVLVKRGLEAGAWVYPSFHRMLFQGQVRVSVNPNPKTALFLKKDRPRPPVLVIPPGFLSQCRRNKWIAFVVGSCSFSKSFFSEYSGFPSLKNPHFQISI